MFPQIEARNQPASSRTTRNVSSPARLFASVAEVDSLAQRMQFMGATMSYARNTEIFGENEPADYLYKVIGGTVRTYKVLNDGRRQIGGFYLPGELPTTEVRLHLPRTSQTPIPASQSGNG